LEYLGVLRVIEVKLASFQASFTWFDAFDKENKISFFFLFFKFSLVALQSIQYDKAAIIWNIASSVSHEAQLLNFSDIEGAKKGYTLLKVFFFFLL
jgi:hypothetical protein